MESTSLPVRGLARRAGRCDRERVGFRNFRDDQSGARIHRDRRLNQQLAVFDAPCAARLPVGGVELSGRGGQRPARQRLHEEVLVSRLLRIRGEFRNTLDHPKSTAPQSPGTPLPLMPTHSAAQPGRSMESHTPRDKNPSLSDSGSSADTASTGSDSAATSRNSRKNARNKNDTASRKFSIPS